MTTSMSKRTQLRNERALQDLVKFVPGNDRCADCDTRNPGASRSLLVDAQVLIAVSQAGLAGAYVCILRSAHRSKLYQSPRSLIFHPLAGHLFVHAMRLPPPQAGYPYIKGQILEHGQLDE